MIPGLNKIRPSFSNFDNFKRFIITTIKTFGQTFINILGDSKHFNIIYSLNQRTL